jgi:hypothetical protein
VQVNKVLLVHHHPLPACADLLNQLARKKFFSKVDLKKDFTISMFQNQQNGSRAQLLLAMLYLTWIREHEIEFVVNDVVELRRAAVPSSSEAQERVIQGAKSETHPDE